MYWKPNLLRRSEARSSVPLYAVTSLRYDYVDQFGYHYNPTKSSAELYNMATNPYIESARVNGVNVAG